MESKTFRIPNMHCNGCVHTVRNELTQIGGISRVDINQSAQLVTVEWDAPASWQTIQKALTDIDYAPAEA